MLERTLYLALTLIAFQSAHCIRVCRSERPGELVSGCDKPASLGPAHACSSVWLQRITHSKVRPSNWPCCTKWSHRLLPSSKGREFLLLYSSKLKQPEPLAVMTEMRELRYTSMWSAYALLCAVTGAPCMQWTASPPSPCMCMMAASFKYDGLLCCKGASFTSHSGHLSHSGHCSHSGL